MNIKHEELEPTKVKLTITAEPAELQAAKQVTLLRLGKDVKVPGFRAGKVPQNMVEKQLDPAALQSEFLDEVVNQLYVATARQEKLKPVAQPQIAIIKFVPFTTLEFSAEVEVVGEIKLSDYKKLKLAPKKVEVTAAEANRVFENLRQRAATKEDVKRAAANGDEVTINFKGTDAKTKEAIEGAEGQDYPLVLGSKNFIPGFEEELIGLKTGDAKTFKLTFPKDYGVPDLRGRRVVFEVTVTKIQKLNLPKLDDAFAASIGPFKNVAELKADIKKQLKLEKTQEASRAYENELLQKVADKSVVAIPKTLVDEEIDRIEEEEKRNTLYRGQTWQDHLDAEGVSTEEHHEKQRPTAEARVKAGLVLGEIAEKEKVTVTPEELDTRIELLKGQYTDPAMLGELEKPENRRDILSRMLTEKTLDLLRTFAAK